MGQSPGDGSSAISLDGESELAMKEEIRSTPARQPVSNMGELCANSSNFCESA